MGRPPQFTPEQNRFRQRMRVAAQKRAYLRLAWYHQDEYKRYYKEELQKLQSQQENDQEGAQDGTDSVRHDQDASVQGRH